MTTRICLVRHGETAWNAERRIQGQLDIPLNANGVAQARATANSLLHEEFAAVYASDLARAHHTAEAIAHVMHLAVTLRSVGDGVIATVQDIDDRDAAQALAGARVFVPRASFPTPDEGEFYWVDLIGLAVVNRGGVALGQVTGLIETGPHCVLRVQEPGGHERLIPFVSAYVDAVDLPGRRIAVDWDPED